MAFFTFSYWPGPKEVDLIDFLLNAVFWENLFFKNSYQEGCFTVFCHRRRFEVLSQFIKDHSFCSWLYSGH